MKHFPAMIDSPKLYLRLLTSRDAAEFYALSNDPKIAGIISFLTYPVPRSFADDWIARNLTSEARVYGAYGANMTLVGMIDATQKGPHEIEVGYWVGSAHTGKGVATEMLGAVTKMIREYSPEAQIFAECLPDNPGSWRVLEKNGFVSTGAEGHRPGRKRLELKTAI